MHITYAKPPAFINIIQLKNDGSAVKDDRVIIFMPVLQYKCHIKVPVKNCRRVSFYVLFLILCYWTVKPNSNFHCEHFKAM